MSAIIRTAWSQSYYGSPLVQGYKQRGTLDALGVQEARRPAVEFSNLPNVGGGLRGVSRILASRRSRMTYVYHTGIMNV